MSYLEWSEKLSIGMKSVDSQHQGLLALVNRLHTAMSEGRGKDVLGPTIDALMNYTVTHFALEESYFDRYGYPGAAAHKLQHADFVAHVADFKKGFEEDRLMLSLDVMDYLSDWLVNHISTTDRAYAPFLKEHGVA